LLYVIIYNSLNPELNVHIPGNDIRTKIGRKPFPRLNIKAWWTSWPHKCNQAWANGKQCLSLTAQVEVVHFAIVLM